jgi:hypothetical protein
MKYNHAMKKFCIIILSVLYSFGTIGTAYAAPTPTVSVSDQRRNIEKNPLYDASAEKDRPCPTGLGTTTAPTSVGTGTLPAIVPEPYNAAFTSAGIKHHVSPALVAALFTEENFTKTSVEAIPGRWQQLLKSHPDPNSGWPTNQYQTQGAFQFIPNTWKAYGDDGNGDGVKDPQNIYDGAAAAAKYVAANGATIDKPPASWQSAIWNYNHAQWYVDAVMLYYNYYNTSTGTVAVPATPVTVPVGTTTYITAGNIPSSGMQAGASIYGGTYKAGAWLPTNPIQDPTGKNGPSDDSGIGNSNNPLPGTVSFAELSISAGSQDFSALGKLPNGTKLEIAYNGKAIIAAKGDVGAGGADVGGVKRSIDLWWEAAKLLDFQSGLGVVTIRPVAANTPLTAVNGAATPVTAVGAAPEATPGCSSTGKEVAAVNCSAPAADSTLSTVRQNVVCLAQQELQLWQSGQLKPGTDFFKYSQDANELWCADFASWIYNEAGYPLKPSPNWRVAAVVGVQAVGQENKTFKYHEAAGFTPKPGDIAVHLGGSTSHVNIVTKVEGSTITLIGGDQGQGPFPNGSIVSQGNISSPTANNIVGYVTPD